MPCVTTCSQCGALYEAGSEEQANEPDRLCRTCFSATPEAWTIYADDGGRGSWFAWNATARVRRSLGYCTFSEARSRLDNLLRAGEDKWGDFDEDQLIQSDLGFKGM